MKRNRFIVKKTYHSGESCFVKVRSHTGAYGEASSAHDNVFTYDEASLMTMEEARIFIKARKPFSPTSLKFECIDTHEIRGTVMSEKFGF